MSLRRKAREFALQMLFQCELSREEPARVKALFWKGARAAKETRAFANQLFDGAVREAAALDDLIATHSERWRFERLAVVDRLILRLGAYELSHEATPPKVVINEAVELAKKFSAEEAAPFVNGILDAIRRAVEKSREQS
jgi:N utilization substance protein B